MSKPTYYDLDGTLSNLNNTFHFIYEYLSNTNKTKLWFGKLLDFIFDNLIFIPYWYRRRVLINYLFGGISRKDLNTYFDTVYKKRFLSNLTDLGKEFMKKSDSERKKSILLTGCTEIPAENIGKLMGFGTVVSTEFEKSEKLNKIVQDTFGNMKTDFVKKKGVYYTDDIISESKLEDKMDKVIVVGDQERHYEIYIPFLYSLFREKKRFNYSTLTSLTQLASGFLFDYLWIPLYALFATGLYLDSGLYVDILLNMLAFVLVYELGYVLSDNFGIKVESSSLRRAVYKHSLGVNEILRASLIRLLPITILILFYHEKTLSIAGCIITLIVFVLHSILPERRRIGTFISLRTLKGIVPFVPVLIMLSDKMYLLILSAVLGISVYYSLEYGPRKLGKTNYLQIADEKNSWIRFLFFLLFTFPVVLLLGVSKIAFLWMVVFYAANNLFFFLLYHLKKYLVSGFN